MTMQTVTPLCLLVAARQWFDIFPATAHLNLIRPLENPGNV
jgi:hypothetical protein